MPVFTNEPPPDPRGYSLPLHRTPTGRPISAIVTSADLVGTPTHFWHGRTVPCDVDDCEPCNNGMPWRWHGYLSAFQTTQSLHFLFEFTARAAEPFLEYRKAYASLRGCHFQARRVSMSANARVIVQVKPGDLTKISLPQPPDLVKCLSIIWNIAEPDMNVSTLLKGMPRIAVDAAGNALARPPDDGGNGHPNAPRHQAS